MTPKRFFALALVLICAFAATSATAASTERLPVTCYAVWNVDGSLMVRVLTPDFPAWVDLLPPVALPTVTATGTASFSQDKVSVDCHANPSIPADRSFWSTPYAKLGSAYTAREKSPNSYVLRTYVGTGTASVTRTVRISAQMHIDYSNWP